MSFTPDQIVTMTEVLVILMGIGITYAVYHGSENAELPGDASIPEPGGVDDAKPDTEGRSL
ncbi:MAG: hypothetical protein WB789_05810 [Thermoplasmata archaeon]